MNRLLEPYAGFLENLTALAGAYFKGVYRQVRPIPPTELPVTAPPDLWRAADAVQPRRARVARYLEITDGVDLMTAQGDLVPPLFYTTWSFRPFLEVLASDALPVNLLGMVHTANELLVTRPIAFDDTVQCRVGIESLERKTDRIQLTVLAENRVDGEVASASRTHILIRLAQSKERRSRRSRAAPGAASAEADLAWQEIRTLRLRADLGRRYGLLVGDVNPIHLHRATAQPFGFKRPIAHGFCLKAMVAHALIRTYGDGDVSQLARLYIAFKRPVPLPSRAVVLAHEDRFQVVAADQSRRYAEGTFELVG
jgi:acyl dehydratase